MTKRLEDPYNDNIIANSNLYIPEIHTIFTMAQPWGFGLSIWREDGSKLQVTYDPYAPNNTELTSFLNNNHIARAARVVYEGVFNLDPSLKVLAKENPMMIESIIRNVMISHIHLDDLSVGLTPEPTIIKFDETGSLVEYITSLVKLVLRDNAVEISCYETGVDSVFIFDYPVNTD